MRQTSRTQLLQHFIGLTTTVLLLTILGRMVYHDYRMSREEELFNSKCLVGCSTSLINTPSLEEDEALRRECGERGIDLVAAYADHASRSPRIAIAWLLISEESSEYITMAAADIASVPFCEIRIWRVRYFEDRLSTEYRDRLLSLLLASPNSEAKLFAGRWYLKQGRNAESDEAFYHAMTQGAYWDARDAAYALLSSERYETLALEHLLQVTRDNAWLADNLASIIAKHLNAEAELAPLIDACTRKEGPEHDRLIAALEELIQRH